MTIFPKAVFSIRSAFYGGEASGGEQNVKNIFPRIRILALICALLASALGAGAALANETAYLAEPDAIKIAMDSVMKAIGSDAETFQNSYWIDSALQDSSGESQKLWQIAFAPAEGVADRRSFDVAIDAVSGKVLSSGWLLSEDTATGERLSEEDSDLAVDLAKTAVYDFFGLHAGVLERYVPDIEYLTAPNPMVPAQTSFEIYFILADAQEPGHYYVTVSAETSTVLRVYHSVQEFG